MKVELPSEEIRKLREALRQAGIREIGGQIYGEQLAPSRFRASEITIQARPGSFARFWVDLIQVARDARRFFQRTQSDYKRFNYLGEWHSHPSFAVRPSETDKESMRTLVEDPDFPSGFAVLMIVKLNAGRMERAAWLFDRQGAEINVVLEPAYD